TMPRWVDAGIYITAQAVSLFNTVLLLWLGLTVLLTGDRRKEATIAGGVGLLLGSLFFMVHTLLIAHVVDFFGRGVNTVWRVMWFVAVVAPYFWGLAIFYYSGNPAAGRWVRRILTAAMFFVVIALFLVFPLPSFIDFVLAPALAPVVAWLYVPYLFLCFVLPLLALRRPRASETVQRDPFRRARPWLVAAAMMLTLAMVAFAYTAYAIVPRHIPMYTLHESTLRELYFADEIVAGFIGLAIIFLGRAVLSNSVLTERVQAGPGIFARWRNVVGVAIIGSLFVALLYNLEIRPIYSVLLTVILAVMAYALFNWRQYVEHEEFMQRLNPFVTSLHLHERLLTNDADNEQESRELFTALCRDALRTEYACLLFDGSIGGRHDRQRIDYQWPREREALIQTPLGNAIAWSRLDVDHWAYPLSDSRGAIGRLILGPKLNGNEYDMQELQVASACAERILDALAGEQLARVAVSLLRQRIAQVQVMSAQHKRILHDEVLPQIHLALLKVEALRAAGQDGTSASLPDKLDEATLTLTQAHRRVSGLVREMSTAVPTRLESEGLAAALQSALDHDFRDSFDRVDWQADTVAVERAKRLPLFASEVIFFAAQEAIRNAAKHGRGGDAQRKLHLDVSLQNGAGLKIIIGDDGVGRKIEPVEGESGSGLRFHSAMLAVIGGTLSVEDRSGGGTQVVIQADSE
ncbi:MAG TPA: ATP-binding protein, partial [Anaerolineae bacterium]|nr:ATP-binding protein [Anaerolineae bacterium]